MSIEATHDNSEVQDTTETKDKVVIYLPNAIPERVSRTVKGRLADTFGGFTETQTRGGWVNGDGELITESVTKVESVRMDDDAPNAEAIAKSTASWVESKTDEDVVMWEVEQVRGGLE